MTSLHDLRQDYNLGELHEEDLNPSPFVQFKRWFDDAQNAQLIEPNAMTLATADHQGRPSARVVLLKDLTAEGFTFFTNYLSRKGRELTTNPFAALVFDWHEMERQVRVEGRVEQLSATESDAYFDVRPEGSRLGAWVSPQSKIIEGRHILEDLEQQTKERFSGKQIHRPPHWGGYLIRPERVEFWQGRSSRLHDRLVYLRTEEGWTIHRLAP